MLVAVTGASGFLGSALVPALRGAGHDVRTLVRRPASGPGETSWDPAAGALDAAALEGVDAIVHLAGESIGQRWTAGVRDRVLRSRVDGTRLLAETIASLDPRPVLVCASAVGFYGDRGDEELTEASGRGSGFLADVVDAWERAADPAREAGARVVHLRQGMVLARHGGVLERLLLPFRLGLGGRVGSGLQWWSWISLDDTVAGYLHALGNELEGPVNLTAPAPARCRELVKALGDALHRPTVLPLPALAVKLAFGRMGEEMLLGGQRVLPARLERDGLAFAHPTLPGALAAALG